MQVRSRESQIPAKPALLRPLWEPVAGSTYSELEHVRAEKSATLPPKIGDGVCQWLPWDEAHTLLPLQLKTAVVLRDAEVVTMQNFSLARRPATREGLAGVYAALGDKDEAFACLSKAYEKRDFFLVFLKVHPYMDPLRADQRYTELLHRIGLDR
jgi:hypothetical protein